jgi:hypothetical protein
MAGTRQGRGSGMGGSPDDFAYMQALMQAEDDGEFGPPFGYAMNKYLEDIAPENPNTAPCDFWPSTAAFRAIVYRAGKRLGRVRAVKILERIPDVDVRLFAQIELAAALEELPEMRGIQRRSGRRE